VDLKLQGQIQGLVAKILVRRADLLRTAESLRSPEVFAAFNKDNAESWCRAVAGDTLVRVRMILEQNVQYIETFVVTVVARYLFELSVWLHLFKKDSRFGLVYYGQLLATQARFFEDQKAQLEREVLLLKEFEAREADAHEGCLRAAGEPTNVAGRLRSISDQLDYEAAKRFSLYAESACTNGYGFQAFLVESKALPRVESALKEIGSERDRFEQYVLAGIDDLWEKDWKWRKRAKDVGLENEYDYIYSFASKLLHATPASITTDQKNLEPEEICVFLKFIDVKVGEIIDLCKNWEPRP